MIATQVRLDGEVAATIAQHNILVAEEISYQARLARAKAENVDVSKLPQAAQDIYNETGVVPVPTNEAEAEAYHDAGVPGFKDGGIVPGPIGMPVPVIAHGGEQFAGVGKSLGTTIEQNFNIAQLVVREEADIRRVAKELFGLEQRGLRSAGLG